MTIMCLSKKRLNLGGNGESLSQYNTGCEMGHKV